MAKLFFASLLTLGLILSFVFGIAMAVMIYLNAVNIWLAIGITIVVNFLLWLFGPFFSDYVNKWFYGVVFLSKEEVMTKYPEVGQIIDQVSQEYGFNFPKFGIINDKNPTAFTYGTARYNARIIVTEGIFYFLNPKEARAVVAHELGHIVNRDFIVMMVASTMIQILYEIYAVLGKLKRESGSRDGKAEAAAKLIGLASYVLYIISIYMLYYLSRTREYLADEFSAAVSNPEDLSNALIKIAYGIVAAKDDEKTDRLLKSTRHLGLIDVKNAKNIGTASFITNSNPELLSEVMVFDKVNPWAKIIELSSTHPLTGKRIDHLSDISKAENKGFSFDIAAAAQKMGINKSKLYSKFSFEVIIYLLPFLLVISSLFILPVSLIPGAFGLGLLLQLLFKYPADKPKKTTILDEMRDPYASPICGKMIEIEGQVIGKGIPGYILSEDMIYQDKTGIIYLDYNSIFGFLGNWLFAIKKLKNLFNIPATAKGWFFRDLSSKMALNQINVGSEKIVSHPMMWDIIFSVILMMISAYLYSAEIGSKIL